MSAQTFNFDANPETRKVLVGIARNVRKKSIAKVLSSGTAILSTEQEVRTTKQVNILIPFLSGVKKVEDVIAEAAAGGVVSSKLDLGERIISLSNELITTPRIFRPRSTEVLQADALLSRYQEGFVVSAQVVLDETYFRTVIDQGIGGLSTGEQVEVLSTENTIHGAGTPGENGQAFAEQVRDAWERIAEHRDGVIQGEFEMSAFALALSAKAIRTLNADKRFARLSSASFNADGGKLSEDTTLLSPVGIFDDYIEVYQSKSLSASSVDIDGILMIKGSAVSQFLFMDKFNFDPAVGVNAFVMSLEFNEGTGVYFPQLMTIFVNDDLLIQPAVGSGTTPDYITAVSTAITDSINPA